LVWFSILSGPNEVRKSAMPGEACCWQHPYLHCHPHMPTCLFGFHSLRVVCCAHTMAVNMFPTVMYALNLLIALTAMFLPSSASGKVEVYKRYPLRGVSGCLVFDSNLGCDRSHSACNGLFLASRCLEFCSLSSRALLRHPHFFPLSPSFACPYTY
jgi:hypothetical protein